VMLVLLSHVQDGQALLATLREHLALIAPGQADALVAQIAVFVEQRKVVGWVGLAILLFFSSITFTVLENAMSVIFFHRVAIRRRHFLVSAIIPYAYIFLLAVGLLLVSVVSAGLHTLPETRFVLFGYVWSLSPAEKTLIYVLGIVGETLLLTSLYLVMPVGRLALRHALIGAFTAVVLWEITRHLLVWYFSTLSLVNVVYGTLATAIIILLSLEVGATILLLGAQVISEYERIGTPHSRTDSLHT
jgi:membrane protein